MREEDSEVGGLGGGGMVEARFEEAILPCGWDVLPRGPQCLS